MAASLAQHLADYFDASVRGGDTGVIVTALQADAIADPDMATAAQAQLATLTKFNAFCHGNLKSRDVISARYLDCLLAAFPPGD